MGWRTLAAVRDLLLGAFCGASAGLRGPPAGIAIKRSFTKPEHHPRRILTGVVAHVSHRSTLFLGLASFVLVATVGTGLAKDPISVTIDRAKVMRISAPAATVVIGNPAIADASIQDRRTLVITGKTTGITNLVILDARGELVADEVINVEKPQAGYVTVQRGANRYTYSCTPNCNVAMEPGDAADYFGQANSQMTTRNGFAQQSAATP
jgi:hypothetical protein